MICFTGNIGVGKSTLLRAVSDALGLTARLEEPEINPFLADFYAGRETALASQLFFLNYLSERSLLDEGRPVLLERCIHDNCLVFTRLLRDRGRIGEAEWRLALGLYDKVKRVTPEPLRYLYCRCPPELARERIRARGRGYEQDIPLDYLRAVDAAYETWIAGLPPEQVTRIDTSDYARALDAAIGASADVLDPLGLAEARA